MLQLVSGTARRDATGAVRHIEHLTEPFLSDALTGQSPEQLADAYVSEVADMYQIDAALMADPSAPIPNQPTAAQALLHREAAKDIAGSYVVNYQQSFAGLPVWNAHLAVHIAAEPMRVTSSTSSLHTGIVLGNDVQKVAAEYQTNITLDTLPDLLGLKKKERISRINSMALVIYQYDPSDRLETPDPQERAVSFEGAPPMPDLPPVAPRIQSGMHYAVAEVLFDLDMPGWSGIHWRAMIEPISGSVLYLRALVASATGTVFKMDPISLSGNTALTPAAPEASLAPWRTTVALADITASSPQKLQGANVDIAEIENPLAAEPTAPAPGAFVYNVKSTNFSAVSAYYHCNWVFDLIRGMGFNLGTYFDHTAFPVPVDHWSLNAPGNVNAHCPGNASGNGIGHFCFAAAQSGQNVGIADDIRVVLHEFGHALLWDHVNSPNFGFAHSAGDSLGAILMDPESKAPDRFLTFPWPQMGAGPMDRRHDRQVSAGWGWFGVNWNTQYGGEQVLSTTLFRAYRSIGGDSPCLADRQWAARYMSYVIIKAIGTLTSTTPYPEVFATALMNADLTTANFEGQPGGAIHKIIRWAFEKQGLYGPNAHPGAPTPVATPGNPPNVDVYIDDGRHGEYDYLLNFWETQDMWVRRAPDGGAAHQDPIVGRPNYMYVRVKNRGLQTASQVMVKAYHANPGAGLAFPTHWSPMTTPFLAGAPIPPGGATVVGPFAFTPMTFAHECVMAIASAAGDPANDSTVHTPIAHSRFVPFDNNIGQRNVHPVYLLPRKPILESIKNLKFHITNPFDKQVKVELAVVLPKAYEEKKYWLFFTNEGGNTFQLGPKERREAAFRLMETPRIPSRRPYPTVVLQSKPGIKPIEEILRATPEGQQHFHIVTLMDGQVMGGMTYLVKPAVRPVGLEDEPEPAAPTIEEKPATPDQLTALAELVDTIRQRPGVKAIRVRNVSFDIDFGE